MLKLWKVRDQAGKGMGGQHLVFFCQNVIMDFGDEDAKVGIDGVFLTVQKLRSNEDSLGHLLARRKVA